MKNMLRGRPKSRSRYFWPILTTLPLSHFVTHPGNPPASTSHISDPPIFSRHSTKIPDKIPLYKFYLNCSRRFCPGVLFGLVLSVPPSVTIHLLQQKVKNHFKFHVSYV